MENHATDTAVTPPGVSVVIPAYNYAHYLPFAINSVLRQDYPAIETIVVDDGSKDNCAEVVARYGDRVRYIRQENAGLSAARNTGIRAASHSFIAFLDADDQWRPGMLSRIMEAFRRLPDEFAVVACGSIAMDPSGIPLREKRLDRKYSGELTARDLVLKNRFYPSAAVALKTVFDECGLFDTTLRSSEDRDMWIRIATQRRIHLIKDAMVLIRKHDANMSRNADRMKRNMGIVLAKARQSGVAGERAKAFWQQVSSFYAYETAWMHHDEGRQAAALRELLASLLAWPFWWNPHRLNEVYFFRLRSSLAFLLTAYKQGDRIAPSPAVISAEALTRDSRAGRASDRMPGVTVVITAYNYAQVLPRAINSVLNQDYPVVETIVVDDGSTDNTKVVMDGYGERVRYIYQPNAGLSAARNAGIQASRHPYVAFLDADDEWLPQMLSTLMRAFLALPSEFGLVACSSQKVDAAGKRSLKTTLTTSTAREVTAAQLALVNQFAADAVVARRDVLERSGLFDTSLTSSEDRDMWIRMSRHCRIRFLPDPLVVVHIHPHSMSTNADRMKHNMRKVLRHARQNEVMPRWNLLFWAKALAFYHYQVAWMYMDARKPGIAGLEILMSLILWPFFVSPRELHENPLFRLRSGRTFLAAAGRNWLGLRDRAGTV